MNLKRFFVDSACLLVSITFIYAGFIKLLDNKLFILQLDKSPLLPDALLYPISIFFPVLEIVCGIAIFFNRTKKAALYTSLLLFFIFTIYLIVLNTFFVDVPCSCGGILGKMSYTVHIIFNIAFILLLLLAIRFYEKDNKDTNP